MKNGLRSLLFWLLLFSRYPDLSAEEDATEAAVPPTQGNLIVATQVIGLKRTRPQVAQAALRKFIGRDAARTDLNEIRAAILDTGILEPLNVEILDAEGGGKLIRVEVQDKWSIFPVPIFFVGSGGFQAGAAFYDANSFGLNHKTAVTGMYRSDGWMVYGMYAAPPGGNGIPGWSLSGAFSRNEREDQDQRQERTIRRFDLDSVNATGSLNFRFTDISGGSLRFGYAGRFLRETEDPLRAPDEDAQGLRMGAGLSLRKTSWDGYLLSEKSVSLGYAWFLGLGSPSFHSLSFDGTLQHSVFPGFRTDLRSGMVYEPEAGPLFESGPSSARVNILPRSFSARHYAGFSLGLEKYLYKFSFGTLSLLAAWQMAYSYGPILEGQFDQGIAASLSLYLSKLAIPALGAGVAYNVTHEKFQFYFSMGMSF
jgi:outer membrane protein assembly factor BamA